jgi:hypothetical protein
VTVTRWAYRASGLANLHPADAGLNLPVERHSHGLRKLAALEAARGSFQDAVDAIERSTGQRLGRRQVQELAQLAAVDFEHFYETRRPKRANTGEVLVLSADGKGIVIRPDALRPATKAARAGPAPNARLTGGQQRFRKRMAEIGAVYDATPAPRGPADILPDEGEHHPAPGPVAEHKWLCASVLHDAGTVIKHVFEEADRRDPEHQRTWVALVDGANHQIQRIRIEARKRDQRHDRDRLRSRHRIPLASRSMLLRRGHPQDRRHHPPPSDQRAPQHRAPLPRQRGRRLPDQQSPLPRLPHRAGQRLADRDTHRRRRLPTPRQRPHRPHRRPPGD